MPDKKAIMAKIRSGKLREMAESESDRKVNVIIRLDLPSPKVRVQKRKIGNMERMIPVGIKSSEGINQSDLNRRIGQAKSLIKRITNCVPVRLAMGQAYAVSVDGRQLVELARSAYVKSIEISRDLKSPLT